MQGISVRSNGTNYSYWSTVMKNFITGQSLWERVTGTTVKPSDLKAKDYIIALAKWEKETGPILTWFYNYSEPSIGMNFSKYDRAKKVWDYLKVMYLESNFAGMSLSSQFIMLVTVISLFKSFNEMASYWDQLTLMKPAALRVT